MAFNANEAFNSALSLFSSLYQDMNPTDLPEGLSPDNQDVWFLPGSVSTRPALNKLYSVAPSPSDDIMSNDDFPLPSGDYQTVFLDSAGNLKVNDIGTGITSTIATVSAGVQFKSETAFDKKFFAFFGQSLSSAFSNSPFVGADIPLYYDGSSVWRVTQDAPGAAPVFSNLQTSPVPLVQTSDVGSPLTVTDVNASGAQTTTYTYTDPLGTHTVTQTFYTQLIYTCSAPVPTTWLNQLVNITGITGTNSEYANRQGYISSVNGSTFTITTTIAANVSLSGESGAATLAANYLTRSGNIVTAYVGSAKPPYFQAGLFAAITNTNGSAISQDLGSITAISRDANGIVTVTISTQLTNLASGTQVQIASVTDSTNFPDSQQEVLAVVSATGGSTIFTIGWVGAAASSSSGTVSQLWNGIFQIQSIGTDPTNGVFFTYFQLGPDTAIASTGGTPQAQLNSQVAPGPRNFVLMFASFNGAITGPSLPVQFAAVGGTNLFQAQNIPVGPPGTSRRIIAATPAFGSSYFYLAPSIVPSIDGLPPVLGLGTIIYDNTSTSAILDFSDSALTASDGATQIDVQGNNLFNQIVLAPCLSVIEYGSRLEWCGEINNIKNLLNMGFDGGYVPSTVLMTAGAGANSGSGVAWSSPGNVSSSSSLATASLNPGSPTSQALNATSFGFALPSEVIAGIQVSMNALQNTLNPSGFFTVQLLKAGIPVGTAKTTFAGQILTSASTIILGSSTDLWGATWLFSDFNASTFGVQITAHTAGVTTIFSLNDVQISVTGSSGLPLAWSTAGSTGGTTDLILNGTLGLSYQMTGASRTNDCMISQNAYQDYYGAPILSPMVPYYVRFKAIQSGTPSGHLQVDLFSPAVGLIAIAFFAVNSFSNESYTWQTAKMSSVTPISIPADTLLRVYLNGVPNVCTVTIDELSLINGNQPILYNQIRASYIGNPFGYDVETGVIEADTSESFVGFAKLRGYLYCHTDQSMWQTNNNGQTEPDGWGITQYAADCGLASPCAIATGAGVTVWDGIHGRQLFEGSNPKKISQENQPLWDSISWNVPTRMWLVHDPVQRIIYGGLPTNGATSPNIVYPTSYRSVDSAYNVPDPLHISYSGKLICSDLCRKSTRWNMTMNCGAMVTINTGNGLAKQMVFGGAGFGNLYYLNFDKFTDEDYGQISSYYTTYFHWNHDMEQNVPLLGLHRKIYTYLSAFITGVGNIQITPLVDNLTNVWAPVNTTWSETLGIWQVGTSPASLPAYVLSENLTHDLEWGMNVIGDRVAFKIAPVPLEGQTDAYFNLQHMVVAGRMDKVFPVRGAYL